MQDLLTQAIELLTVMGCGYVMLMFLLGIPARLAPVEVAEAGELLTGEAENCKVCGEPAEWPELCQEHWEAECSEQFWHCLPEIQEAALQVEYGTAAKSMPVARVTVEVAESDLHSLTIRELKRLASAGKVKGYSNMTKAELIERLAAVRRASA